MHVLSVKDIRIPPPMVEENPHGGSHLKVNVLDSAKPPAEITVTGPDPQNYKEKKSILLRGRYRQTARHAIGSFKSKQRVKYTSLITCQ